MPLNPGRRLPAASTTVAALFLPLTACAALALTGCGGDDPPDVATAATASAGAPAPTASSGVVEQYVAAQRKFVACMRENGVALPDPDAKGRIDFGHTRLSKTDPTFLKASEKCAEFAVPVPAELEDQGPPLTAEQIANVRRYADCMRANGVPEFRDPDANGRFTDEGGGAQVSEQGAAAMFRAGQICEPVLEGRPPTTPNPAATGQG